jgi:hypothetical protein
LFQKLLMDGEEPVAPPTEWVAESMGGLVEVVSGFGSQQNAIGFSVFYYVNNMFGNDGFKLLAIDDITPTRATIAREEYALTDAYYAVVRRDTPAGSPARLLIERLLSPEGQTLASRAGYIPLDPAHDAWEPDGIDPVYLGEVNESSGTGGTVFKTAEERAEMIGTNVRRPLSDMFFNGFNYIQHINAELIREFHAVRASMEGAATWEEELLIRPFTGIPNDYPHYSLRFDGQNMHLNIMFPAGNPFFGRALNLSVRLTDDISPYGTPPDRLSVQYGLGSRLLPRVDLLTIDLYLPEAPEIAAKINGQLRNWERGFPDDEEAMDLLAEFMQAVYPDAAGWNIGWVYRLQPTYGVWRDILSVSYITQIFDGPTNWLPMVFTIAFDLRTGEQVELVDLLPSDLDLSEAGWYARVRFEDGRLIQDSEGRQPSGDIVITEAWLMYGNGLVLTIAEPDGFLWQVTIWQGWAD